MLLVGGSLHAQAEDGFFAGPLAEAALYSRNSAAFGGGFILGGGGGSMALGLMTVCFVDGEKLTTLEITIFFRRYLLPGREGEGLFAQVNGGVALFNLNGVAIPAKLGMFSAGLTAGWRFLFGELWYVEPTVRVGWPYIAGAGVSAGFRF
ncbi:MAG: hypothetical protein LBB82_09030 [Treponema sp.]|jgi:hypothetical protein|nr:hypothetical protein [Treponema sp.]